MNVVLPSLARNRRGQTRGVGGETLVAAPARSRSWSIVLPGGGTGREGVIPMVELVEFVRATDVGCHVVEPLVTIPTGRWRMGVPGAGTPER